MKITRSTFTRKALTFGIVVFMSVALVASGFAAWLISSGSKVEGNGEVKVEVVNNANITINVDGLSNGALSDAQINFAPQEEDKVGYIQNTTTVGGTTLYENLSFDVKGTVDNGDKVGTLTFSLKVSDGVCYAAGFEKNGSTWTYNAEKAYILLPSYATDNDGNALPNIVKNEDGSFEQKGFTEPIQIECNADGITSPSGDFVYTVSGITGSFTAHYKFGWGEAVNGGNPGITLDELQSSNVPACVKDSSGNYSLKQAELVIRLINAIVNEKQVNGVDAHTINPVGLSEDTMTSYFNALVALEEAGMEGATYTVVIKALPKA